MFLMAGPGLAAPSQQVPIGPRALAMGGAFSAIADDAGALYWNPAGLPLLGHQEISGSHADLFGSGITDNFAAFVLPLTPIQAMGADWYHSGFDDGELNFGENRIDLAYGRRITRYFSAGGTVKFLSRNTDLDGTSVRRGSGFGFDLGVMAFPRERLRLALAGQDITDTRVSYTDGEGTAVAFPRNLRAGISYDPQKDLTVAFDTDDRWHAGAEYRALDLFSLRGGLQDDWRGPDGMSWSAGAGIKVGMLHFDYALVDHPTLGSTSHFGASLDFNFNPAQVRIEKVEAHDIFGSLYKTYSREPFGTIRLRNLDQSPISTTIRVFVPELMSAPTEQTVILRPKATQEVAVTAVLTEQAVAERGDRPVQAQVTATYQSHRLPRTERRTARFLAYGPGAIDWSAGVAQAAAFITPLDPAVDAVARSAARTAALMKDPAMPNRNLAFTAAIFDAISALGVTYVPDPNTPFTSISETPRAVDAVSYPRETLARKTGDCDDTSVLVAALLGNVGIATQLVDVPGHLFILADTGVHSRNSLALGLEESRYVVTDDEVWIPLETTALGKGFAEAWRLGAEAYSSWAARGRLALVDVAEASNRYEPADLGAAPVAGLALGAGELEKRVNQDLDTIAGWRAEFMTERFGGTGAGLDASPEALNEVARAYFLAGKSEQSNAVLERAREKAPGSPQTLNNLADVHVALGDLPGAFDLYQQAARADSSDAGVWLNLGLVRYVSGDTLGAEEPLARGVAGSGGYEKACRLLGLVPEGGVGREGVQRMTAEEARMLLKAALKKVPRTASATGPGKAETPAPRPTPRRWTSRVAGGRSADEAALQDLLYWR
jgi:tetratricopeptide (TPR) repeat protein